MFCDCGQPLKAKGLCAKHYLAAYRERKAKGEIVKIPIQELLLTQAHARVYTYTTCAIKDCGGKIRAKSLCSKHYLQLNRAKKRETNGN
jgi:hypothetical protein